jgi:hypothetical protein
MAVLPATGTEIVMGRVKAAYSNVAAAAGQDITLSGTLGGYIGQTAATSITLSATFGGRTTPYAY